MTARERTGPPISHLELLTAARAVQRIAVTGDADALHAEVCRLRNALATHVHDERATGGDSADIEHRLTRHGQQRLLRFIDEMLSSTSGDNGDDCTCLVRVAELRALLLRQVKLENQIASGRPSRP